MKNRLTVKHGMLDDLKKYLTRSGWHLEEPKGEYEVLRARKKSYPRPLLVYDRTTGGCGYSIDERDLPIYVMWRKNRQKRGLDGYSSNQPYCFNCYCSVEREKRQGCPMNEYGYCVKDIETRRKLK